MDMLEAAALEWARDHGFQGDRLPAGIRYSSNNCPLARATRLSIFTNRVENGAAILELPPGVQEFITAFDDGEMPDHLYEDE